MSNSFANYPEKYLLFNSQTTKNLAIVMEIEGVSSLYGISDTFTQVRYGDPDLVYGLPGLVYGGLRKVGDVKSYMVLDGSMTIGQKIEPESGRGNIGTLTITLIDNNGEISQLIAPGIVVDEILFKRQVRIWLGFTQTSYPEDYLVVYQGYFTSIDTPPSVVKFQISDTMSKVRQPIANTNTTTITAAIGTTQTLIPVADPEGFYAPIMGPDGTYDPLVQTFIRVDDEIMLYDQNGIQTTSGFLFSVSPANATVGAVYTTNSQNFTVLETIAGDTELFTSASGAPTISGTLTLVSGTGDATISFTDNIVLTNYIVVTRGMLGSVATTHDIEAQVTNSIQVGSTFGINVIEFILKLLLSGWDGPCETGIVLSTIGYVDGVYISNAFTLSSQNAILDLGFSVGDYFTITGATNPDNNISGRITGFSNTLTLTNGAILTDQTFVSENPTSATGSFRSQFDTLPIELGLQIRMRDVDMQTFFFVKNTYFNAAGTSNVRLYVDTAIQGLDLIATQLCLPFGLYNISRFGKISISITKPPLPGVGKLVSLDWTNILNADKITVTRSTNNRSWYNLISYEYDYDPVGGTYGTIDYFLDSNSLNQFGGQVSQLPIQTNALHSDLGGPAISQTRGNALLTRYKTCTLIISVTVNWTVGSLIEVSDIVLINDNGQLQIMNYETGIRNLGSQLFEVIDRQYNIMDGTVALKVMSGLGFNVDSRFALFSPSSVLAGGSTSTQIILTPSFGQTDIMDELAKWTPLINLPVQVHSYDWSVVGQSTLVAVGNPNPMGLTLFPALGFTPGAGYIIDIAPYPNDTDKTEDSLLKTLYAHISPSVPITSGVSVTEFNVSSGDAVKLTVGNLILVRSSNYGTVSPEVTVSSISGTLVTTAKTLGFVPDSTYFVEGIGFRDGTGFYRWG